MPKKKQQKESKERFDATRPQFRRPPRNNNNNNNATTVTVDARFAAVVTDPNFQTGGPRGEANNSSRAFYTLQDEHDDDGVVAPPRDPEKQLDEEAPSRATTKRTPSTGSDNGGGEEVEDPASRIAYLTALSRGLVDDDGSSSSSSDDDEVSVSIAADEAIGVLDPSQNNIDSIPRTTEQDGDSPYLAVMQLDWDHIRAVDIVCILNSFTTPGAVRNVTVYLSDFGKEQLERDRLWGPGIWKTTKRSSTEEVETEDSAASDDDSAISRTNDDSVPPQESDFDPEKLRAYEASKLRYYFAVAEFSSAHHADVAYHQVDGLELDSGFVIDLRMIPSTEIDSVILNRSVRDTASGNVPSTYDPPESVMKTSCLQHSTVECTWDTGDVERERVLTQYSTHTDKWAELADSGQQFNAYIASDASTGGEQSDDDANSDAENDKAGQMRKMLGLDSDSDEDNDAADAKNSEEDSDAGADNKVATFVPGQRGSTDTNTATTKEDHADMLSPWEKYQQKRKEKRREKRAAARERRKTVGKIRRGEPAETSNDDFFLDTSPANDVTSTKFSTQHSKAELELLLAGDDDSANGKNDYDMRGLERMQKVKDKKLRGARKRKEAKKTANVTGTDFAVDVADERFQALLDGTDGRFGIDRTDARFRDTEGMHKILDEQTRRRRRKKRTRSAETETSSDTIGDKDTEGSSSLGNLVRNLKAKVQK